MGGEEEKVPSPHHQKRSSRLSPLGVGEVSVCPGGLWGPGLPGGQPLGSRTLSGGRSLQQPLTWAKILPFSEPGLNFRPGVAAAGKGADTERGASLSGLLRPAPPRLQAGLEERTKASEAAFFLPRPIRAFSRTKDRTRAAGRPASHLSL